MARRTAEKAPRLTPIGRAAFRGKLARSRGGSPALSWTFALVWLSALSCGYCEAESEFSILEEAQVLADQMKKLSSQELGVFTMQVRAQKRAAFEMRLGVFCSRAQRLEARLKSRSGARIKTAWPNNTTGQLCRRRLADTTR